MANPNDNIRRLYQNGLKHFSLPDFDTFQKDMMDEQKRRRFYTNMQEAYSLPDFDTFSKDIGAITVAAPAATPPQAPAKPQRTPATVQPVTDNTVQNATVKPTVKSSSQPAQPEGWKPSPMEQRAFQMQMDASNARLKKQGEEFQQRMEGIKKGKKSGAFMGEREFNPQTGQMEKAYYGTQGERLPTQIQQSKANTDYHQWWENNTEEGQLSKEKRLKREFDARLSALWQRHDPAEGENAAEKAWSAAESRQKASRERNAKRNWDNYASMGGGREMRVVEASSNRHEDMVDHLTNFDLDRLMNDSWENLGEKGQKALIDDCYKMLSYRNPGADKLVLYNQAKEFARQQSNLRLYNLAVEKNRPQNELDYLIRKVGDMNMLTNISKGAAVSQAKSTGDMAAYEAANEQYRQDGHKILDVTGMVAGFALDPTTWLSGSVGGAATRSALWMGGRYMAGRGATAAVTKAATRQFATSMTGRFVGGVVGGSVNFGTFEGIKEMENQLAHGGKVATMDEDGNLLREGRYVNEGYSASAVGGQTLHGLGMGAAIGWLGPVTGNVSDKLVRGGGKLFGKEMSGISNIYGKTATRAGLYAGATITEGTIFSVPEWIEGKRDGIDVWTDNMAMMVGFKAKHMLKSAGGVLGDLKASFDSPSNGAKNRLDFESRLRQRMDAPSDGGLALTKDEKAELQRYGYDLRELVESAERTGNAKEGGLIAQNAPEIVSRLTDMVSDPRVSEAARAKIYYYATGRMLPMSTVMRGEMFEDGNGGFIVESQGANGVITSRSFKNRKAANLELERINRQTELNTIEIGERYQQTADFEKRLQDACRTVAAENGWDMVEVYRTCEEARRNHIRGENKEFEEAQQNILRKVTDAMGEFEETGVTDALRNGINKKYGVDIDEVIRKEANRRTLQEQTAIDEYLEELIPDKAKENNPIEDAESKDITDQKLLTDEPTFTDTPTDGEPIDPRFDSSTDSAPENDPHQPESEQKPIGRAVMKYQDRPVEVMNGRVVMTDDGTMIDKERSDKSIVIRDLATGKIEMVAPDAILSYNDYNYTASSETMPEDSTPEATPEVPIEEQPKYTSGQIKIRNSDGTETRGILTGYVDEKGNHEYYVEGDLQHLHYASDHELDNILSEYLPDEPKEIEQTQQTESQPVATNRPTQDGVVNGEDYDKGYSNGIETAENLSDALLTEKINKLRTGAETLTDFGRGWLEAHEYEQQRRQMAAQPVSDPNAGLDGPRHAFDEGAPGRSKVEHPSDSKEKEETGPRVIVPESNNTVTNIDENVEIPTGNRESITESGSNSENSVGNVQQTADDGFIPVDPELINSRTDENGNIIWDEPQPKAGNNSTENIPQNGNIGAENIPAPAERTALQRIPRDEKGEPVFELAESPEVGWDALVEFSKGNPAKAQKIADIMVETKRKEYEKAQKLKPKGKTPSEILKSEEENEAQLTQAENEYNLWQRIAGVEQSRQNDIRLQQAAEARRLAAERAEVEKTERESREEAARLEREALEGIPEWHIDTPENARKRGIRRFSGQMYRRPEPISDAIEGNETEVKFSNKDIVKARYVVIEASQLQPSHIEGVRNPYYFIEETQPKNRVDAASIMAEREIATNIRPSEIIFGETAYTGAPVIIVTAEGVQGHSRMGALKYLWENNLPEQQNRYVNGIVENAVRLGVDPEEIKTKSEPVLARMIYVDDAEAIRLGQMTAQDTESGGIERIKPKNVAQKLGEDMRTFANRLLNSSDEEASFGQLVDRNGTDVLKWMSQVGAISNTQYQSAFDSKGNLTAEAKNDLQKVLYQAVFKGGSQQLEEMFDKLPAKAQRAILSTAFRDMDSPLAGKMLPEIQASIIAYNMLMSDQAFTEAKNMEQVLRALTAFKRATALDDRFEQYIPADNFSNFALHLAGLYKASDMSQTTIASYFNQMYDLAQGKKAATLFEDADTTEYPLAEVIKKVLNIDYQPAKNGNNNVANGGADVALRNQAGQGGEPRGREPSANREQAEGGTEPTERGAGATGDSRGSRNRKRGGESQEATPQERLSKEEATDIIAKMEMSAVTDPKISLSPESWQNSFGLSNSIDTPLGKVKMGEGQYQKFVDKKRSAEFGMAVQTLQDPDVIFIEPSEAKDGQITERGFSYVFVKTFIRDGKKLKYYTSVSVLKDGMEVSISSHIASKTAILKKLQGMERAYTKETLLPNSSEWHLAEHPSDVPDLLPTQGKSEISERKVTNSVSDKQEKGAESSAQPSDNKGEQTIQTAVEAASAEVNTDPTPAQVEAGNYKKGHVTIGEFDITIENPAGSTRKGVDAKGKAWSTAMVNAYGYIKGTESKDGDHIDVFLHQNMDEWNGRKVYVVDQTNQDGTFDEHKVMLGFNDKDEAMNAYLANYDATWAETHPGIRISETNIEDFNKWVQSSHRNTKPFADYSTVSKIVDETPIKEESQQEQPSATIKGGGYEIVSKPYTNKRNDTLDTYLVTFDRNFSKEEKSALRAKAKGMKGWYDRETGGWMLRSEEDAKAFAEEVARKSEDEVADEAPLSMSDMQKPTDAPVKKVDVGGVVDALNQKGETKLSDHAKPIEQPKPKKRRWISDEDADEFNNLRNDLRNHFGKGDDIVQEGAESYGKPQPKQMDAEVLRMGTRMTYLMMKGGLRSFADYCEAMKDELPDIFDEMRPHLKSLYAAAQNMEEVIDLGWDEEMDDRKTVKAFDVYNFDKTGAKDIIETAGHIVDEQKSQKQTDQIIQTLKDQRNEQRKQEADETSADTEAIVNQAEASASKVESQLKDATTEGDAERLSADLDKEIEEVNKQLALLGYYEADPEDKDFNEAYGYMRNAERKATQYAHRLATQLAEDLGITIDPKDKVKKSEYGFGSKIAHSNVAPAGGEVYITIPISGEQSLSMTLRLDKNEPWLERGREDRYDEDLVLTDIRCSVVNSKGGALGGRRISPTATYDELLSTIRRIARDYLPADVVKPATPLAPQPGEDLVDMAKRIADARAEKQPAVESDKPMEDLFAGKRSSNTLTAYDELKGKHKDTIVLLKVGDFYTTYRDDAATISNVLGVTLTRRPNGNEGKVELAGFPSDLLDQYLPKLIRAGHRVALGDYQTKSPVARGQKPTGDNSDKPADATATVVDLLRGGNGSKPAKRATKPEHPVGDLFGDLFDMAERGESPYIVTPETEAALAKQREAESQTTKLKEDERTEVQSRTEEGGRGGQQPRPNEQVGTGAEHENERTDRGGMAGRGGEHTVPDTGGSTGVSGQHQSERNVTQPKNTNNNHIERGVELAPKGEKARISANIAAIRLVKKLLESGCKATPQEMEVLSRYSGWGGLGSAFNEGESWRPNPTYQELKELLTQEEFEAAVMSRNSAYFTPAPIIDTMWDIAKALGFKGGNVVEGSAGIGKIIGQMPTDLSARSNIHAVEIDPMTGGMLSLLYPDAKVDVQGFEQTRIPNGSVDLAITNVPFVTGLRVADESGDGDLSKKFRDIHDFCIAKNVRKLREGGIGIFITSSGTLDKSQKLRNWLVGDKEGNADVVGVFRLNNQTFGGTAATSDIIVVRKRVNGRKSVNAIDVSTVSPVRTVSYGDRRGKVRDMPMLINRYFIEHPEFMGGEMFFGFERGDTYRPESVGLFPVPTADQTGRLTAWLDHLANMDWSKEQSTSQVESISHINEKLGEGVKEGSMVLDSNGNLCVARMGEAEPLTLNQNKIKGRSKQDCFNDYTEIKDALAEVLKYQTEHDDDKGLQPLLDRLNRAYDTFVERYGNLNKNNNLAWLRNDVDFSSIVALETYSEKANKDGSKIKTYGKTDIFSRRVVEKESEPTPKNVKDGIIASLYKYGRIDPEYLAEQLGKSQDAVKQEIVGSGLGYEDPITGKMEVSYEYLSGNVREKLRQAREANETSGGKYEANVKALEAVVPMNIPAHLIEFALGSSWVDPQLYERFIKERTDLDIRLTNAGGTWHMNEPYFTDNDKNTQLGVRSEKLGILIPGHKIIEAALTNKTITVSKSYKDSDGTHTETDPAATTACATKVDEIRQDFKDWSREQMQIDPELSMRIEETYNEKFNNSVPKSIPDEFVPEHFGGAATMVGDKPFRMRPHQAKAVIRATTQPVLLAHEVGTGKTYTLITTAMEMRRLGTARKPMIVVQNATVGQFVASAKALYPNAKILTLEDADRNAEGRKVFYAKIKFNDWDMIVVPQSVFERIPDSIERQTQFIQDKIDEKLLVLEQMKNADPNGRSQIVRGAEREIERLKDQIIQLANGELTDKKKEKDAKKAAITRQNAEVRAKELLDRATDDVEDFDSMGIDAILVDEAHEYKHLGFATAMQHGVKGIDSSASKKSQGVYLKAQGVLEKTGGKNVVFATGTPISNTAAEIWTFMRYLMPADVMRDYDIFYFDDFVRNFGNLQQMLEFKTNGKYQEVNRFAGYFNLPELVRIWSTVADTVLTREAGGVSDKIPKLKGGKATDIFLPQTRALRSIMKYVKEQLDEYDKMSGREKKENSHIPLVMYGIAKAAAVDARLVQADAEDDLNSKTNACVRHVLSSLKESSEYKGTYAIFADNYQNKASGFNLYEDIKKKLIAAGIPEEQIVVMKSGMSVNKKLDIFNRVNAGEVRVILGSTFTLGTGVNIQERLHKVYHLDAPNRPMDYTQRNGRLLRQGNLHNIWGIPVEIIRFGVEDSLDVTAYQRLKTKGAIADSIMNGKQLMENSMENRSLEEDQDLFGDITAQLSGSEYAMLKNQIEKEVRKLRAAEKNWKADQTYIHNRKRQIAVQNKEAEERIATNKAALEKVESANVGEIRVGKLTFPTIDSMEDFFKEQNKKKAEMQEKIRTDYSYNPTATSNITITIGGFDFNIHTEVKKETKQQQGTLFYSAPATMTYSCSELGIEDMPVKQNLLKNAITEIFEDVLSGEDFRGRIEAAERSIERNNVELESMSKRDGVPFKQADELAQADAKLAEYEELMKQEMEAKEAKYAEMDKGVEAASNIELTDEDSEETASEPIAPYSVKNRNFASRYETQDGKTINYTSENPEGYGGLFDFDFSGEDRGGDAMGSRSGFDNVQRERSETLSTTHGDRLNRESGEYSNVERVFNESGSFKFTSGEKIESAADVAFIFSALEDAAVEHTFAVYVKDGVPTVVELGMGSFNASIANSGPAYLAYSRIKPDEVYFVHNHPSGNLKCSAPDVRMLKQFQEMCDVPVHGVIINLKTGKYGTFDTDNNMGVGEKRIPEKEYPLTLHKLDKQIFAPDYDPMAQPLVRGSHDVASFVNSHRMGDRAKMSFLVISQSGRIVGNIHMPYKQVTLANVDKMAQYISERVIQFGGISAIVYGDFPLEDGHRSFQALKERLKQLGDVRLNDIIQVEGNCTFSAYDEGLLYEPGSEYGASPDGDLRYRAAMSHNRDDFDRTLEQAIAERGIVMPGLNEAEVKVVEVPRHDFTGTGKEALKKAETWAKEHITGIHEGTDNSGNRFEYSISNDAVEKYVSKSATSKSVNIGVHLAALKKLPEIISNSVEAEIHADYTKNETGTRAGGNEVNPNSLIHRFYGAIGIDGIVYRVKTTMREYRDINRFPLAHSYEVAQIELLEVPSDGIKYDSGEPLAMTSSSSKGDPTFSSYGTRGSHGVAKLLQKVEKSYDAGKFLLEESKKETRMRSGDGGYGSVLAQTSAEAKSSHAERMSKKFNTPVRIITDVKELPASLRDKKGAFDVKSSEVIVVIPNHESVEDVAETVFHEVVGHKGLREMIGEENYDAFCDEVYGHLKEELKEAVDEETTRSFMNEPGKGYEYHRRVSVDELFGRMAEKGFEEFTKAERGVWAKLKAKVMEAINKFLGALKLPKWVKLGDNELRYMLWRSHERLRTKGDYVDMARDAAKREELGLRRNEGVRERKSAEDITADRIEKLFDSAVGGDLKGKPVEVGRLTEAGREYLEKLSGIKMKDNVSFVLNPSDLVHMYRDHFGNNEKDKGNNIPLDTNDIRAIAHVVAHPERVIFGKEPYGLKRNLFYFLAPAKEGTYNLLEIYGDRKGNLTAKTFYKTRKGVSQRVLSLIKSEHLTSVTDGATLSDSAKLPKFFDNPTIVKEESFEYRFRDGETGDIWKDRSVGLEERITNAAIRLSNNQSGDLTLRNDAMGAIGGNLTSLRKAMAAQKRYDQATVKRVADLARILMQNGYLSGMTSGEMQRMISAVKNSVGHKEVKESVQKIMDIMVNNHLRNGEATLRSLLAIRGSKVDARGVEVQGILDVDGQRTMEVVKKAMSLSEDDITDRIAEALNRMSDSDNSIADQAALEYAGLNMAFDYVQNIAGSKAEEQTLRDGLKTAKEDKEAGRMTADAYKQFVETTEDAIRKNKIERAESYFNLVGRLSDSLRGSIENAKAFREAEKARVNEIHHNANSDMEGRPTNEHHKDDWKDKVINNGLFQSLFAPLGSFDQIMRVFGNKSANGEGYLWNRFMRGWVDCRNQELQGVKEKFARLDEKAAELFGKGKTWGDLLRMEGKLPKATVSFWDGGEMRDHELTQGNLLYIYMVDKMTDGRMKLRRMGITEDDITEIENVLDPRFKAIGDWLQDEFLVETRNEYNETHKRMFGASMAAIENYFPLKILANARVDKEEDVNQQNLPEGITTKTGSIIKRRVNNLALDITGADALSVILDHITQMEHWSAYAEWNRDLNTLRTYKRFRNQVINMTTVYGGGRKLWENFNNLCLMAAGEYRPPIANLDKGMVNVAKGVTAAKVSFRMFTALKQFLSAPAYIPEVSVRAIAKSIANPYGDFKWCMENLPIFRERWESRISGDPRLLKSDMDWKMWRSRIMELSSRIGMTPNAFVDAVTVSIGARAMYETRLKQYLKEGYPGDAAEKRAMQDATILFNQTQQSSESPFLSTMQVDRSWLSVLYTVFRNSSMSYGRQEYDAMRNLKRNLTPGQRAKSVEFMTKQILRDWDIDPEGASDSERSEAREAAKKRFSRQIKKDALRVATFGFILEALWNLGPYLPYIFFGNDDDEKDKMWDDAMTHAYFGSVEGLTGGDVMSSFGNMAVSGEWSWDQLTKDMPLASDINAIVKKFIGRKNAEAVNDILNLLVQSGIGMNPQSLTDAAIAITDACGDDPALSHEAAMFVMRVLQVPQSQLDKLYFDEIGLSGEEASKLIPEELAGRYAEYKVKRGTPLAPWSWGDEERLGKYEEVAKDRMKERLDSRGEAAVLEAYADFEARYKAVGEEAKKARALMKTDYTAAAQAHAALQQNPDFGLYQRFGSLDKQLGRLSKMWLSAKTPEESALIGATIPAYRAGMVRVLQAETMERAIGKELTKLTKLMNDFYGEYQSLDAQSKRVNR